ncbi:MAG: aminopeptidase, partial [Halanaerobiales bacterium]|nr:aminopeptidase [Halanaerobiales bacterium]
MAEAKLNKYAELLVNYSLEVKKGDQVLIQGEDVSKDLIKEVYKEVLKNGGHPLVITKFEEQAELFYKYASEEQLNYSAPFIKHLMENVDASLRILGHNNTKNLAGVDPEKIKKHSIAQKEISEIMMNRAAEGSLN